MSFSDYLAITGILVSLALGLPGAYLIIRRAKYPGSLTFVREQSVSLFKDFSRKIPNLSVTYKDTPIDKSVILISGHIVNDGSVDISPDMIAKPLTCTAPPGCRLLEFKVTTASPALHATSDLVSENSAEINFGLFRRDESFSFQALALIEDSGQQLKPSELADKLAWKHRIASLGEIKTLQMPPSPKRGKAYVWSRRVGFAAISFAYAFIGLSALTGIGPLGKQPSIIYTAKSDNSNSEVVHLSPNRDGTTTVLNKKTGISTEVDLAEYTKSTTLTPFWTKTRNQTWINIAMGIVMLIAAFAFFFNGFGNEYKRYRLRRLLRASSLET